MPRLLPHLVVLCLLAVPLSAQKPSTDSSPTIKTQARLVLVDAVVTDRNGKAVHGLKATDFHLTEDNAPQAVRNFEEHVAGASAQAGAVSMPQACSQTSPPRRRTT